MSAEYDRLAEAYGRHRKCHEGVLRELAGFGLNEDSRVLEIGAGTGNYIVALRELTGCRSSAVEPSSAMLDIALSRAPEVEWRVGGAEALPFESESFEFAFCVDVVHHVADRQMFFAEALRVLAPGGTLCIVTDSEDIIRTRFPLAEYFPDTIEVDLARYPRVEELERLAEVAGFRDWRESSVVAEIPFASADSFEAKAFSVLHLVPEDAFAAGLARLKADLGHGPLQAISRYAMLWATK